MLTPDSLRERLIKAKLADEDSLRGCKATELNKIERKFKCKLPKAYKGIMKVIGKSAGLYLEDVEYTYPEVLSLREDAEEILGEFETELPDNCFVFAGRGGGQFFLFHLGPDDPKVIRWHDSRPDKFKVITKSLTRFFENELLLHEDLMSDK